MLDEQGFFVNTETRKDIVKFFCSFDEILKIKIMKSLSNLFNEVLNERKYHLSYDMTDEFVGNSNDAKHTILQILKKLGATSVHSPCESTIVFTYPNDKFRMTKFTNEIGDDFYFSLCLVAQEENIPKERISSDKELDHNLQKIWREIKTS